MHDLLVYATDLLEPGSRVVTTDEIDEDVGPGVSGVVATIVDEPTGVHALLVVPESGWVLWAPLPSLALNCAFPASRDRVVRWASEQGLGDWSSSRDDAAALTKRVIDAT